MNEEKLQEMFRHRMRYETIIALEEAGETAAVTALIKIWKYDHLNLPGRGGRAERARFEMALFDEQILELEFEVWIAQGRISNYWQAVLASPENIPQAADSFYLDMLAGRYTFLQVHEFISRKWHQEKRKRGENANDQT